MSLVGVTNICGSVVDDVPPVTGLIGWRNVVELRRLRLVLMSGGVPGPRGIVAGQSGVDHCPDAFLLMVFLLNADVE